MVSPRMGGLWLDHYVFLLTWLFHFETPLSTIFVLEVSVAEKYVLFICSVYIDTWYLLCSIIPGLVKLKYCIF